MVKVKTKKKKELFENTDIIGFLCGYCEEFFEGLVVGDADGVSDNISSPHHSEPFAKWLQGHKDFMQVATNSDFGEMEANEIHAGLRMTALKLLLEFYEIERYDDFGDEVFDWEMDDIEEFFENEEWFQALKDLSKDDTSNFEMDSSDDEEEEEEEEEEDEISLDEAIANNAIAGLAATLEAEVINLPTIPDDLDSSVDNFMNELNSEAPVAEITLSPSVSSDAVPWATLAAIAKHKSELDKNDNPVKALANALEELVEEGAVVTKRGLLDAMLILIEAEPSDAMRIVELGSKLN